MFFAATLIDARKEKKVEYDDKTGKPKLIEKEEVPERKERQIIFNTDEITYMIDNPDDPDTTWVFTKDRPCLIKGSFAEQSKILLGFNRK